MEVENLRAALKRFSGNPQYRKFVRTMTGTGKGTGKFLYWQEKLWQRFIEAHPEYATLTHLDLENALNLCHLHLLDLVEQTVKAHYIRQRYPEDYLKTRDTRFPYANMVYFGDPKTNPRTRNRKVAYCAECRKELIRWNARRKEKFALE